MSLYKKGGIQWDAVARLLFWAFLAAIAIYLIVTVRKEGLGALSPFKNLRNFGELFK